MEASVSVIVVAANDRTRRGLCRRLRQEPGIAVIGEAPEEAKARLAELIDALKQVRGQELARATETVASGQSLLDPGVTQKVLDRMKRLVAGQEPDGMVALSPPGAEGPRALCGCLWMA